MPRDFDADLRTKLTLAGQQGGFVLLSGHSSVGKTRALFEALQVVVPDWWLLHPCDTERLREFATHPTGRTVVWLDEPSHKIEFFDVPYVPDKVGCSDPAGGEWVWRSCASA